MKTSVQHVEVGPEEAGQKLLQYLVRRLRGQAPQSAILRWIRRGEVRVDKGRAKPFMRLRLGQVVRIPPYVPDLSGQISASAPSDLDILFEDARLVVINKPAGLPTQPGTGWTDCVSARLAARYAAGNAALFTPTPAHRLDKDTSGVLLAGKTYVALRELQEAFRGREAQKEYLAWVRGVFTACGIGGTVAFHDLVEKRGGGRERMRTGSGKKAELRAAPLVVRDEYSLLRIRLLTGRTHQIRVQLSSRGWPIVGDGKYGGGAPPMYLHAWRVVFGGREFIAPPDWRGKFAVEGL